MQIDPTFRIPLTGSRKIYQSGNIYPDLRIPVREISLTNGENFFTYDTSGAFTDEKTYIDITQGLPAVRNQSSSSLTQLAAARRGIITPEMEYAAIRENQNRIEHGTLVYAHISTSDHPS